MAFCAEALFLWESLYGWRDQGQWYENGLSWDGPVRRSGVLSGPLVLALFALETCF